MPDYIAAPLVRFTKNIPPVEDGDITLYIKPEARASGNFRDSPTCIFVNGMGNGPADHQLSATTLSLLQMAPVYGVYNKSDSFFGDLWQCATDKYKFEGTLSPSAQRELLRKKEFIGYVRENAKADFGDLGDGQIMEAILSANPATAKLFRFLRQSHTRGSRIYAHSQGNIILANALSALAAVDGAGAIAGREVHSYGSPTVTWPAGLKHQQYAFTGDMVALMAGVDLSFGISKVGLHNDSASRNSALNRIGRGGAMAMMGPLGMSVNAEDFFSHSFLLYMENDPAFVVNRFRWGGWGATASMDEPGLAAALLGMGRNGSRVRKILKHLDTHHNYDADDVAYEYVRQLRASPHTHGQALSLVRSDQGLCDLLVGMMDEGWTTTEEQGAIDWIEKNSARGRLVR